MTHSPPDDTALNAWLEIRHFEPHRADLSERIMLAARARSQKTALTIYGWLQTLFAEFALPRPAYVLASLLCLGFLAGLGEQAALSNDSSPAFQAFLYDEGDVL
jgi:hypothetical protein